jgi:hypothetical protein
VGGNVGFRRTQERGTHLPEQKRRVKKHEKWGIWQEWKDLRGIPGGFKTAKIK